MAWGGVRGRREGGVRLRPPYPSEDRHTPARHSLYVHIAARERGRLRGWRGWGEGEGVRRGEAMVGQSVVEKYRYIKKLISR
jgi:hypothetical protein